MNYFFNTKRRIAILSFLIFYCLFFNINSVEALSFGSFFSSDNLDRKVAEVSPGNDETKKIELSWAIKEDYNTGKNKKSFIHWEVSENVFSKFEVSWYKESLNRDSARRFVKVKSYSSDVRTFEVKPYWGDGSYYVEVCGFLDESHKICDSRMTFIEAPIYYDFMGLLYNYKGLLIIFSLLLLFSFLLFLFKKFILRKIIFRVNVQFAPFLENIIENYKEKSKDKKLLFTRNNFFLITIVFSLIIVIITFVWFLSLPREDQLIEDKRDVINGLVYEKEVFETKEEITLKEDKKEFVCKDIVCTRLNRCTQECMGCASDELHNKVQEGAFARDKDFYYVYSCLDIDMEKNITDTYFLDIDADGEDEIGLETSKGFSVMKFNGDIYEVVQFEKLTISGSYDLFDNIYDFKGIVDYNNNGKSQILVRANTIFEYIDGRFVLISGDEFTRLICDNQEYNCIYNNVFSELSPNKSKIAWITSHELKDFYPSIVVGDSLFQSVRTYHIGNRNSNSKMFDYLRWEDENNVIFADWADGHGGHITRLNVETGELDYLLDYLVDDSKVNDDKEKIIDLADNPEKILSFYLSKLKDLPVYKEKLLSGYFACDNDSKEALKGTGYEIVGGCLYKDGDNILNTNLYGLLEVGFFGARSNIEYPQNFPITELSREEKDGFLYIYLDLHYELLDDSDDMALRLPYFKINLKTGEILREHIEMPRASQVRFSPNGKKFVRATFNDLRLAEVGDASNEDVVYTFPAGSGVISAVSFGLVPNAVQWLDNNTIEVSVFKALEKDGNADFFDSEGYEQVGESIKIDLTQY